MNTNIRNGPIMAALLITGFVGLFSETALNITLGDLKLIFGVNATTIQWLATGYFLTLGILVPVTVINFILSLFLKKPDLSKNKNKINHVMDEL